MIDLAKTIATEAHQGQTYGPDDRPYTWHLQAVADLAQRLSYQDEVIAACWLHDIVEDTYVTAHELLEHFPRYIVDAVIAVTFVKGSGSDKIEQAKSDPIGHVVKFCDASINYSASALLGPRPPHTQWEVIVDRYGVYVAKLLQGLPTPDEIKQYVQATQSR